MGRAITKRPRGHREPEYLVDTIVAESITKIHFVPSMLKLFLDEGDARRCRSLTRVFASGEALSTSLVDQFYLGLPSARLYNFYGPTEAAVEVTSFACVPDEPVITIGSTVPNT